MAVYTDCAHCDGTGKCSCRTCWEEQKMPGDAETLSKRGDLTVCSVCKGIGKVKLED